MLFLVMGFISLVGEIQLAILAAPYLHKAYELGDKIKAIALKYTIYEPLNRAKVKCV